MVFYTLSEAGDSSRENKEMGLRSCVLQTVTMCMNLGYVGGRYEIKILRAIDEDVREVVEIVTNV